MDAIIACVSRGLRHINIFIGISPFVPEHLSFVHFLCYTLRPLSLFTYCLNYSRVLLYLYQSERMQSYPFSHLQESSTGPDLSSKKSDIFIFHPSKPLPSQHTNPPPPWVSPPSIICYSAASQTAKDKHGKDPRPQDRRDHTPNNMSPDVARADLQSLQGT